jgi:hypothetical protein
MRRMVADEQPFASVRIRSIRHIRGLSSHLLLRFTCDYNRPNLLRGI